MNRAAWANIAAGDFSEVARSFTAAGFRAGLPAPGILQLLHSEEEARTSVLLSVGIHGDETAPIEMLAALLEELAAAPAKLAVDLMLVVGNLAAIAEGKRYLDSDLNRHFSKNRTASADAETRRADQLMRATDAFFSSASSARWHIDLHTAIRASRFPTFAIVPDVSEQVSAPMLDWLAQARIEAAVLNRKLAGTYSSYSAVEFAAIACTAELGRVAQLGSNDLSQFAGTQAALRALLSGEKLNERVPPETFEVAQELIKFSDAFQLNFDAQTENFTAFAPQAIIAQDEGKTYRVGESEECVVFPNAAVAVGKRAGLMVRRLHPAQENS